MKCQYCRADIRSAEIVARRLQEEFVEDVHFTCTEIDAVEMSGSDEALAARLSVRGQELFEAVRPYCFACWQTMQQKGIAL